jgi:hypothetical protein
VRDIWAIVLRVPTSKDDIVKCVMLWRDAIAVKLSEVDDYVSFDGRMQIVEIRKHDKKEQQKR